MQQQKTVPEVGSRKQKGQPNPFYKNPNLQPNPFYNLGYYEAELLESKALLASLIGLKRKLAEESNEAATKSGKKDPE